MSDKKITHNGILEGFRTLNDGTCKFSIACQEMGAVKAGQLVMMSGKYIHFAVSEEKLELEDIPKEVAAGTKRPKSKSQRLRNSLYILWEQSKEMKDGVTFDDFYDGRMEQIINMIKQRFDE